MTDPATTPVATPVVTTGDVDAIVDRLTAGELAWARTPLSARRDALLAFQEAVAANATEWVELAAGIKRLPAGSPLVGEEWITGPWAVLGYAEALAATLRRLDEGTDAVAGYPVDSAPGDRVAVSVLPHNTFEWLLLNGFRAEVWMPPGVTEQQVRDRAGLGQRRPTDTHGVALVLGAGNITSIPPLDVLHQLYAENRTAALKLNPLTDPLAEVFGRILAPFIDLGVVEVVTGGAEVGSALAHHPGITAAHVTGSEATHDAIVWGPGTEGQAAKAAGTPLLDKPMTSELGGVSPVIVVPGRWSKADLRFQAQHVATQRLHNSGFNCVAAQVVILSSDWDQKDAFLAELRAALAAAPARPAWYPNCDVRVDSARVLHPDAEIVGGTPERTVLPGLDLADVTETAFSTEYFGPVLGITELPGTGAEFLAAAVEAANEKLHGTLGANIVVHPKTARQLGPTLRENIARLRYGTIGVNAWTGVGYLTARATWGAFPGHTLDDVQSGIGVVHNALLLDAPERTVVYGPFRPIQRSLLHGEMAISPKPAWFVNNKTAATTGRRLTSFAARPRWSALPAIFASALRG